MLFIGITSIPRNEYIYKTSSSRRIFTLIQRKKIENGIFRSNCFNDQVSSIKRIFNRIYKTDKLAKSTLSLIRQK